MRPAGISRGHDARSCSSGEKSERRPFVITAGPTREYLDPVRFLSNPSTGKMGFAVARAAAASGHPVALVAGPVSLRTPKGVTRVDVVSARDMLAAVVRFLKGFLSAGQSPVLISAAAVADWRPAERAPAKLKKSQMADTLRLVRNPDILQTVGTKYGARVTRVGFAAETGEPTEEAARKCREKGLALVVANDVTAPGAGFGTDTNRVVFVRPDGSAQRLPLLSKLSVARRLVRALD